MAARTNSDIAVFVAGQETPISKKRGPKPRGAIPILVRLEPLLVAVLDEWISLQGEPMTRPEAIRRILAKHLN